MNTTLEELARWMSAPRETENLEFKEANTQYDNTKLYRYCVALANEGGGKFILGVTDKPPRKVCSTKAFHTPVGIQSRIFDTLHFRVTVEEVAHPDGRVLIFHIPSRPRGTAYHYEGAYLMRSTEGTVSMSEDRLREIFDEGKPDWLMQTALKGCSESDVIRLLDTQSYFDLLKLPYPASRDGVVDRLEKEELVTYTGRDFFITNLGAVLFAKKLDEFEGMSRKAPRVAVYSGVSKVEPTRLVAPGTKGYAVGFESLIEFIYAQLPSMRFSEVLFGLRSKCSRRLRYGNWSLML